MNFSIEEAREHEAMQRLRDHEAQEEQKQYIQRQSRRWKMSNVRDTDQCAELTEHALK